MTDSKKIRKSEIKYTAAKAILGSIPLIGAATSELFGLLIKPPLERRMNQLTETLGEKLKEIEENNGVDLSALTTNNQFIDIVLKATNLSLRTSEEEKISAFQNVILNTALGQAPEKTKSEIFLNLLDAFTVWHMRFLHFINDPKGSHKKHTKKLNLYKKISLQSALKIIFPELKGQDELSLLIWLDLERAMLHDGSTFNTSFPKNELLVSRTTTLGKEFLQFISEHE